jgi:hypothetical protein
MQTPDNNQHWEDKALEAPPPLVAALKRLPQPSIFIPPTADEAILRAARKHLNPPPQPRPGWFQFLPWLAAAAAAVLLLVAIPQFFKSPAPTPARDAASAKSDFNHDHPVDILDAFALARQLKQGRIRDLRLDVNGDGIIDEYDVTALAAQAVKLDRGGRS